MEDLDFEDLDRYLLGRRSKIIHQVWFGTIPDRKKAAKALEGLKKYRDSWLIKNDSWGYICWNLDRCRKLVSRYYPQHLDMYDGYPYPIQRCDAVRYFILHRYGGLYADMDYFCNRSWDEVLMNYPKEIYLVETPNKVYKSVHVSNSLMYSKAGHVFWSKLFIELEVNKTAPLYYSRHMAVMFTTGPGILNRVFNRYQTRHKLHYYPFELFHPYGLNLDSVDFAKRAEVYAIHIGKGSWETNDSRCLIFLYQEWRILITIILIMILPSRLQGFLLRGRT